MTARITMNAALERGGSVGGVGHQIAAQEQMRSERMGFRL